MRKNIAGAVSAGILTIGAPAFEAQAESAPAAADDCVYVVQPGDTLTGISTALGISVQEIAVENQIANPDRIDAGQSIDVCIGNQNATPQAPSAATGIEAQQAKLNGLLAPYGYTELVVDGISGPLTEQALCAGRILTGQVALRDDMTPGSHEERALLSANTITTPAASPNLQQIRGASRWILINQTCQVMVAGEHDSIRFVLPVSTGTGVPDEDGYPTQTRNGSDYAFRYDPAVDNGGWHDSSAYPSSIDNPLNGNMYKPVYFDRGQAIHGANTVPPKPASHGCVRTNVADQDMLVNWLGLSGYTEEVWGTSSINVLVAREGQYVEDQD